MNSTIEKLSNEDLIRIENLIPMPTIILNFDKVLFINSSFTKMLGYNFEEIRISDFKHIVNKKQMDFYKKNIGKTFNNDYYGEKRELCLKAKNNQSIWVDCKSKVVNYEGEIYILIQLLDVTDKKKIQLDLSRILKLRESMLEVTQSIISSGKIDEIYELILTNALKSIQHAKLGTLMIKEGEKLKVVSQIGFDYDSIKGFEIPISETFLYKATNGKLDKIVKIDDLMKSDDYYHVSTINGKSEFIKSTITAPIYIQKQFFGVVNIDSTEVDSFDEYDIKVMEFIRNNVEIAISNQLLYEEKLYLSRYDSLTNLFNRNYFEQQFENLRERAIRYEENFNIVIFDLNELKLVNDNFGHIAGDIIIQKFANTCSDFIRKSDILARYGGDEFIGLLFNSNKEELEKRINKYIAKLENDPVIIGETPIICSFSYGIASFGEDGFLLDDLVKVADERMYRFKMEYKR